MQFTLSPIGRRLVAGAGAVDGHDDNPRMLPDETSEKLAPLIGNQR